MRSLKPPIKSWVYIELLSGLSDVFSPNSLITTLLFQGYIFEMSLAIGLVGRRHIPRTGQGGRASSCPYPTHRSSSSFVPSVTSPNNLLSKILEMLDERQFFQCLPPLRIYSLNILIYLQRCVESYSLV